MQNSHTRVASGVGPLRTRVAILSLLFAVAVPSLAFSAIRYVADTGLDSPDCGLTVRSACRSITQAIGLAVAGDTIIVGPGRYGDLNENGILGEPGEEHDAEGGVEGCMVEVNKPLIVVSSGGAAVTMIVHGPTFSAVCIISTDVEFGRPGKGFTVKTRTGQLGININVPNVPGAANVFVRGNMVVGTGRGTGIRSIPLFALAVGPPIVIEGNYVTNLTVGIAAGSSTATSVTGNHVTHAFDIFSSSSRGIETQGATVSGNVVSFSQVGISMAGAATVRRNAVYRNGTGARALAGFTGVFEENNIIGNGDSPLNCGVSNDAGAAMSATKNYWGAPGGPGAPPADEACGSATTTSPFAKKPYTIKILKP